MPIGKISAMNQKVAIFKIVEGQFEEGFVVNLRIKESDRDEIEIDGRLLPCPDIPRLYKEWKYAYRISQVGFSQRQALKYRTLKSNRSIPTNFSLEESQNRLEHCLNRWLNNGSEEFRPIREGWLYHLNVKDSIRFIIQTREELFWYLPWHLCDLFQRYPHSDIALSIHQKPRHILATPNKSKVKILAVLGEATDINVQADLELLRDRLPTNAELLNPLIITNREILNTTLWKEQIDILFFAGHSHGRLGLKGGQFYLNDDEGLSIRDLKYSLKQAIKQGLKLAIFNSCSGVQLAQDLADLRMPAIIVMREDVPDRVAQQFLEYFIEAFAQKKKSLYLAVREARERLHGLNSQYAGASWLPLLCQHPAAEDLTWTGMVKPRFSLLRLFSKVSLIHYVTATCAVILALSVSMKPLSKELNRQGSIDLQKARIERAEKYFDWALKLNSKNASAWTNKGLIYEIQEDFDRARKYYHKAKLMGHSGACNQSARLDILDGNYMTAASSLKFCLVHVAVSNDLGRYHILKNLGWTLLLLEKENYNEAESSLREAIKIDKMRTTGPANCLLAMVLEKRGVWSEALTEWEYCLNSSDTINEEREWKMLASQRIQQLEEQKQ